MYSPDVISVSALFTMAMVGLAFGYSLIMAGFKKEDILQGLGTVVIGGTFSFFGFLCAVLGVVDFLKLYGIFR